MFLKGGVLLSDSVNTKNYSVSSVNKIIPVKPVNDEFTLCKVYVQGVGKNRNFSYMSKENIMRAEPTLHYIPVVGHLMAKYDKDGNEVGKYFGGHDYEITDDFQFKPLTVPFGVVTEDPVGFEEIIEYGKPVEYMTANIILWTGRYPDMCEAIYSDDVWFSQSMEINVSQFRPLEEDSNYTELLDWQYSALCILGKSDDPEYNTEPCFISSKIIPETYSFTSEQFNIDMREMQEHLAFILSPKEGGEMPMNSDKIAEIFKEFNIEPSDVDFNMDGLDEDGLRSAISSYIEAHVDCALDNTNTDCVNENENTDFVCEFVATYNQRREALNNALDSIYVRDQRGDVISATHYWVIDFDDQYVYVERHIYNRDGDDDDRHGRFSYSFNEENHEASMTSDFEEMFLMWLTSDEKTKLENSRNTFEELLAYKEENERNKKNSEIDALLNKFTSVDGMQEKIDELKSASDIYSFSFDDLETKLFAICGKLEMERVNDTTVKVGIVDEPSVEEYYGGLLKKKNNKK